MELVAILLAALAVLAVLIAAIFLLSQAFSAAIGFALAGRSGVKKWQSLGKYAVIVGIPLWIICDVYFSLHPGDDFYLQRHSVVALRDTPKSARVVAKSASLFGLHSGESCAYSRIVLSQQDYSTLHQSIASDPRFTTGLKRREEMRNGTLTVVVEDKVPDSANRQEVARIAGYATEMSSYVRTDLESPFNRQYALIFLSDEKHIEVHSCL
jgi:hypothetical protein